MELRQRLSHEAEAASSRLQSALDAERASYRDHLATFEADLAASRLEVERLRAAAGVAHQHWETVLEDERRRRQADAASHEVALVSLRRELSELRVVHERSIVSHEESRGALQRYASWSFVLLSPRAEFFSPGTVV